MTLLGVSMASNAFSNSPYDWTDTFYVRFGSHFIGVIHEYYSPDPGNAPVGWRDICLGGGVGDASADKIISSSKGCGDSIYLPPGSVVYGFRVESQYGLRLSYNMTKPQFEAAFRAANIRYVG